MKTKFFSIFLLVTLCFQSIAQDIDSISINDTLLSESANNEVGYVALGKDTLFMIETGLGPYSAGYRAESINHRIKEISQLKQFEKDSFLIVSDSNYSVILYQNISLMSIGNTDAILANKTKTELAELHLQSILVALENEAVKSSAIYWIKHIIYTILALFGLIIIFKLINRLFRWFNKVLDNYQNKIKRKRKSFWRYLAPQGPDSFFNFILKISKIVLLALILFFYLPLMFSFLPWTEDIVDEFYAFVSIPLKQVLLGLWLFISQKLIYIVIIFYVAKYILHILGYVSREVENEKLKVKGFHRDWAKPTYNLMKIVVIIFTIVFMFPYLPGSDSKAFQGVSIFLGVLLSLGSTSAIANIVAGIVITYMRPFQIGDRVKIGETTGDIMEKNLLVTRIKTIKNEDVTIPNATIINTHLWNYTKNASELGIILHTSVTIGYDVPSKLVNELLIKAAHNTPNLTREFKPFVLQKSLNDFYVEYELNVYTKQPNKSALFYSELHKTILEEFNKAGVEIMSPHYTAYRDGNNSTIIKENKTPTEPKPAKDPITKVVDKITGKEKTNS